MKRNGEHLASEEGAKINEVGGRLSSASARCSAPRTAVRTHRVTARQSKRLGEAVAADADFVTVFSLLRFDPDRLSSSTTTQSRTIVGSSSIGDGCPVGVVM